MFLVPNRTLTKKGLSGGKIESGNEYRELTEVELKIIEPQLHFWKKDNLIVDSIPEKAESKSDNRLALEKEAGELEIEFTDRTSGKEIQTLIDAKKAELEE